MIDGVGRTLTYILTQEAYKFMYDISEIETKIVSNTIFNIIYSPLFEYIPQQLTYDLMGIAVDEAYHAYVAIDYISQVEDFTGIVSLQPPKETSLKMAMTTVGKNIPEKLRTIFEAFAICIAENSITSELLDMNDMESACEYFCLVNKDHLMDEARHAIIFTDLLKIIWENLNTKIQNKILGLLPEFMNIYLSYESEKPYSHLILSSLNIPVKTCNKILSEVYVNSIEFSSSNPVVTSVNRLFNKVGIDYVVQ
jgi:hypothetical protein